MSGSYKPNAVALKISETHRIDNASRQLEKEAENRLSTSPTIASISSRITAGYHDDQWAVKPTMHTVKTLRQTQRHPNHDIITPYE
jgi:hypothetical protein